MGSSPTPFTILNVIFIEYIVDPYTKGRCTATFLLIRSLSLGVAIREVVQLIRMLHLGCNGREFESRLPYYKGLLT